MSGKGFDTRKLMTGKDGKLFITLDGVSIWFASVEEFSIGMNVSNVDFHPAGDVQTYGAVSYTHLDSRRRIGNICSRSR